MSNIHKGLQTSIRGKIRPRTKQKKSTAERVIRVNISRRNKTIEKKKTSLFGSNTGLKL